MNSIVWFTVEAYKDHYVVSIARKDNKTRVYNVIPRSSDFWRLMTLTYDPPKNYTMKPCLYANSATCGVYYTYFKEK